MTADEYWPDTSSGGLKSRSVRGASITALVQVPKVILMLGSQLVLARLLLPADFGLVAMVTPVIGFVQVLADLGLTQAVVSRPRLRMVELNTFFWINLGVTAVLGMLAALFGPVLAWLYGEPRVTGVTVACAGLILLGGAGMLQSALLNRQMRYGAIALIEVSSLTVSVVLSAALAWSGWSYWSLVIAQAGASVTATALAWGLSRWRPRLPSFDRGGLALARFGGDITVSNMAGYLNMTLDNVMIGAVLGRVVLGLYDRAWKLAVQPLSQIQTPFHRVAVPALSRLVDEPDRYRHAFLQMTQAMLLAVTPAMIFAGLLAQPLIGLVLGPRWLPGAPIFAWLCVGAALTPVNSATFWLLVSQGRAREQMVFGTAAAAINVIAYACGLPWGIAYVAAASALSVWLIQAPMLLWVAVRRGAVGPATMARLLIPNLLAAGATALVLWQTRQHVAITGFATLILTAIAAMATYVVVLACIPASRAQLRQLSRMPHALRASGIGDAMAS